MMEIKRPRESHQQLFPPTFTAKIQMNRNLIHVLLLGFYFSQETIHRVELGIPFDKNIEKRMRWTGKRREKCLCVCVVLCVECVP